MRTRRNVSIVIATVMAIFFLGGWYSFRDAPLHPCVEHGYCGKQGQPHTQAEYEHFMMWQSVLTWGWPAGVFTLYFLNRDRFGLRRRSALRK